jgi:hypothetical protein
MTSRGYRARGTLFLFSSKCSFRFASRSSRPCVTQTVIPIQENLHIGMIVLMEHSFLATTPLLAAPLKKLMFSRSWKSLNSLYFSILRARIRFGYPLAFVDSSSINESKVKRQATESNVKMLGYDDQHRNVFVPNMKKGQMLVFKGSDVFHGSVTLVEHQGLRKSIALFFPYRSNSAPALLVSSVGEYYFVEILSTKF